jgi:hypothetical protein
MDHPGLAHDVGTLPQMPSTSRTLKRSRENETPAQRQKREKAAERQRRKRERDRQNAAQHAQAQHITAIHHAHAPHPLPLAHAPLPPHAATAPPHAAPGPPNPTTPQGHATSFAHELSPEESARRERVRTAARERQRKHRALVKARKMQELGLDMGNPTGMDDVQYRINPDGSYHQVFAQPAEHEPPPPPPPPPQPMAQEPPFPQGQVPNGSTFASTLLLSFSCAPLLKQHILRILSMTEDELKSLEPVIAHAWDKWDAEVSSGPIASCMLWLIIAPQRRYRYATQGADPGSVSSYDHQQVYAQVAAHAQVQAQAHAESASAAPPNPNDFRARFHRPLTAPSPFQQIPASNGTAGGGPDTEPIDPHLVAELGHARGEAEGVAEKLR